MNIILIGAQGSGKGTQAAQLACDLNLYHLSSGDLFRKAFEERTELGLKAKTYVDRGELVPDALTVAMVLEKIEHQGRADGILLDGFPRTLAQAEALDSGLARSGRVIDAALYLEVPPEELLTRLAGRYICRANQHVYNIHTRRPTVAGYCDIDGSELYQRPDDQGEAVQKRLDTFFSETIHLLDYYDGQHKLLKVNGDQDIERVHQDLLAVLSEEVLEETTLSILPWQIPVQSESSFGFNPKH